MTQELATPPKTSLDTVVTVWRDGTWQLWGTVDAIMVRNDPDWLTEFSVAEVATVEREACARAAEDLYGDDSRWASHYHCAAASIATAIRARGESA